MNVFNYIFKTFIQIYIYVGLIASPIFGQQLKTNIHFIPKFGNQIIELNSHSYSLNVTDSIQFESIKFYISGIKFIRNDSIIFEEENSYHLVDVNVKNSLSFDLLSSQNTYGCSLIFNLGIDSMTNVSGALGGALDPTQGMYWAWQSGYINVKIEGKSNICATKNNQFHFHLGGYLSPFNNLQRKEFFCLNSSQINIEIDLKAWMKEIDLVKQNSVMSPSQVSVELNKKLIDAFKVVKL